MKTLAILLVVAATNTVEAPKMTPRPDLQTAQSWSCQPRKTCGKISSCEEANWYLQNCSWGGKLDGDSDGTPCESIC
jgi:hypothetical protein